MLRVCIIFILLLKTGLCRGQTLGGGSAYNFLKLPAAPLLTAAGGVNVSYQGNDVGLSANNPALLNREQSRQLGVSFNNFISGIKTYGLSAAYHPKKIEGVFGAQVYFVDYGSIPQTDAAGNESGTFHPVDYAIQLSYAHQYLERWHYGGSLKFIHSQYQQYQSSAFALDAGLFYSDTANLLLAGLVAKNMGFPISTYAGTAEDLPFDLQIGITKRLAKAPFAFSLSAQQVHQFNIFYQDTAFNTSNGYEQKTAFIHKLFNHFVATAHIFLGANLEANLGYNFLRRAELNIDNSGNGLNGFSLGLRAMFQKLDVVYARSSYQRNIAYNQLGINLRLNKLFGWESE